jgi:conjugal transfer/entry exclusion protein
MASIGGFFKGVGQFFKTAGQDIVNLVKNVITTFTKATSVWGDVQKLIDSFKGEVDGWKHFKEDIRLKSRVIQLEEAFQKTRALVEGIPASWHAVLDLFSQIKSAFARDVAEEEGAALLAVETAGLAEVAVAINILYQVLNFVETVVSDLQTIIDEAKGLRLEVEKLDTVFLQQDNKRKTIKLANGKTIRVRLGKLHK